MTAPSLEIKRLKDEVGASKAQISGLVSERNELLKQIAEIQQSRDNWQINYKKCRDSRDKLEVTLIELMKCVEKSVKFEFNRRTAEAYQKASILVGRDLKIANGRAAGGGC